MTYSSWGLFIVLERACILLLLGGVFQIRQVRLVLHVVFIQFVLSVTERGVSSPK